MSASARIEDLKKRYEDNPRRFFAPLANEYRKSGDLAQAIALCQAHLSEQPGTLNGHVVYGQALFDSGRLDEAVHTFETALSFDPENLIALRHLGDIAMTHGDADRAGEWYRRVLESDPRNHEVLALVASLTPKASPAARVTPFAAAHRIPTPAVASRAPTPAAPTPVAAMPRVATPALATPRLPTPAAVMSRPVTPAMTIPRAATPAVATPSVRMPTPKYSETAPLAAAADGLMDLDINLDAVPDVAPGGDFAEIDFLFGDAVAQAATPAPVPDEPLRPDARAVVAASPASGQPQEAEEVMDAYLGHTPSLGTKVVSKSADRPLPFVTETMAELYLQQGFHEAGLEVYQRLLAQNPDDPTLQERVRALEAAQLAPAVSSTPATSNTVALASSPTDIAPPSRSARAFFGALASRRATKRDGTPASVASVPVASSASPPNVSAGGTIDRTFGDSGVDPTDEHAAQTLATMAVGVDALSRLAGRPTQPAPAEFSLDNVFRETPAAAAPSVPATADDLRFDEFFSPVASPVASRVADAAPVADEVSEPPKNELRTPAELAEFQDWLQQLKKP